MTLEAILLALALAAPQPWAPPGRAEPEDRRAERLGWIAGAAADAAESPDAAGWPWTSRDLAVLALVVTWYESGRWSARVHAAPWTPDVRGTRATCLGQLHATTWVPYAEWRTLAGADADATRRCLGATVRVLARHAARCRVGQAPTEWQIARVVHAYGTGSCARSPARWARGRAWVWRRWLRDAERRE